MSRPSRSEWAALVALYAFTALAVTGYGVFALHPERLPTDGFAPALFRISFKAFAQLHIGLAFAALAWLLFRRAGLAWLLPLAAVYAVSFTAEHLGTGTGIPFGGYGYTGLLGAKLGGRVPFLIPLSWFLMALPAWVLAGGAQPAVGRASTRILVGALWLTVWDLALDPAMSHRTAYWRWQESGPYYGMPWLNLAGWYATGVLLMGVLEGLSVRGRLERLPPSWMAGYYGAMLAMPLGMLVAAGAWPAVGVTASAVGATGYLTRSLARGESRDAAEAGASLSAVEA